MIIECLRLGCWGKLYVFRHPRNPGLRRGWNIVDSALFDMSHYTLSGLVESSKTVEKSVKQL